MQILRKIARKRLLVAAVTVFTSRHAWLSLSLAVYFFICGNIGAVRKPYYCSYKCLMLCNGIRFPIAYDALKNKAYTLSQINGKRAKHFWLYKAKTA